MKTLYHILGMRYLTDMIINAKYIIRLIHYLIYLKNIEINFSNNLNLLIILIDDNEDDQYVITFKQARVYISKTRGPGSHMQFWVEYDKEYNLSSLLNDMLSHEDKCLLALKGICL